jgi:hypothetical protein
VREQRVRPDVDDALAHAVRLDDAAASVLALEQPDAEALPTQLARGGQAGDSPSNDHDIYIGHGKLSGCRGQTQAVDVRLALSATYTSGPLIAHDRRHTHAA